MTSFGPNLKNELAAAGVLTAQISWKSDGTMIYGSSVTTAQRTIIDSVVAAHDPTKPDPNAQLRDALAAGVTVTSTSTPALNGTYGVDRESQRFISGTAAGIAARNRVPGGGATFNYGDLTGGTHAFSAVNFLNLADAVEDYVYALYATAQTLLAGGTATWPSNHLAIA